MGVWASGHTSVCLACLRMQEGGGEPLRYQQAQELLHHNGKLKPQDPSLRQRLCCFHELPSCGGHSIVTPMQVVLESRRECQEAQKLLGMVKTAFPEVLTAIKTKQLAQEILLTKEEHIGEVEKTGGAVRPGRLPSSPGSWQIGLCQAALGWPT